MPPRPVRARLDPDNPVIAIRARYMEAIRHGATIEDATSYGNGESDTFRNTAPIHETAPQPGYGKPGERTQVLPKGWSEGDAPPPPKAVDETQESIKRPMTAAPVTATPAPVSPPAAVSAPVETTAPAAPTKTKSSLPPNWDQESFPWPKLRALTMAMGGPSPKARPDAVEFIRAKLAAE